MLLILTERELRAAVKLDLAAVGVVERAFAALATANVIMPPILSMAIPEANAEVDVKTASIPGFDGFAIKVSPGRHQVDDGCGTVVPGSLQCPRLARMVALIVNNHFNANLDRVSTGVGRQGALVGTRSFHEGECRCCERV